MNFILVGASLFASNIGSGHFIGLAGSGAAGGIGVSVFELNAIFVLMILGWIFVPVYIASGVYTMPEYIRKRFGGQRIRVYLAVLALLLSIFTKISADLYAGAVFIEQALGWNLYLATVLLLAIAALFTITGGLTAVIWTDFIQTIIMLIGSIFLMIKSFMIAGNYTDVTHKFMRSVANSTLYHRERPELNYSYSDCGFVADNSLHLVRAADDSSLPWPGVFIGLTISSIWYWCSDQVIVQRTLAAKNLTHAKAGCITAGYLKILPMWIIVVPGMISRILFVDEVGCADPDICEATCGIRSGCTNIAYPLLVLRLMPVGARGLMLAVMLAALMSSLTSIFNSSSTLFTIDVWTRFRKNAQEWELMIVGRVFVLFMVAIGIAWIPIVQNFSELFVYIQSVTSYLAPPICAIYILAIAWKRINEKGAFWALMVGLVTGLIRFGWESAYPQAACGEPDTKPAIISKVHYLHFGILLWGITTIVAIVVSLCTEPIDEKHLVRLTFSDRYNTAERVDLSKAGKQKEKDREAIGETNPGYDGESRDVTHSTADINMEPEPEEKLPCYRSAFNWICGIEKHPEIDPAEVSAMEAKHTSLAEEPLYKKIVNVNAIVLMTAAAFIWGFFA